MSSAANVGPDPIVRREADGRLDEVVAANPRHVHLEAMGEAQFWIGIVTADGRYWHVNVGALNSRARGYARIDEQPTGIPPPADAERAASVAKDAAIRDYAARLLADAPPFTPEQRAELLRLLGPA